MVQNKIKFPEITNAFPFWPKRTILTLHLDPIIEYPTSSAPLHHSQQPDSLPPSLPIHSPTSKKPHFCTFTNTPPPPSPPPPKKRRTDKSRAEDSPKISISMRSTKWAMIGSWCSKARRKKEGKGKGLTVL